MSRLSILIMVMILGSCQKDKQVNPPNENNAIPPLFVKKTGTQTGIDFQNTVQNKKDFNIFTYRNFYNGGGVGIGDLNNDGLPDVYLTANQGANKLYLNKGDFSFKDITESAKVAGSNSWSTGVTLVDINADGYLDIYVCNAGNVAGDNQKNELFINNGDLTFTENAEAYGLADSGFTTHAAFFDYDLDGDLDAYILNNSFIPVSSLGFVNKRDLRAKDWQIPEVLKGGGDKLLRNDNGTFTDVSEKAGIYGSLIGFGLGVTVGDINQDHLPDIYVSNDFYERDYLYINQGDGSFKEDIKNWVQHLSISSMGADMADINNDGYPEVFVTDMLPEEDERLKKTTSFENYDTYQLKKSRDFYNQYMQNSLQLNNGDQSFSEISSFSGVAQTDWSWGALLFDMNNDGYRDIFVSNGIYHDLTDQDFMNFFANDIIQRMTLTGKKEEVDSIINKMPSNPIRNYAFQNNKDLTFTDTSEAWGFSEKSFSNGAAYGDLDNDGDLDLIVNNVNMPAFVYENTVNHKDHNFLKLKVKGSGQNTFAIGAVVELFMDETIMKQELIPTRGFQSSVEYIMTLGLGAKSKIDSLRIQYPDKTSQIVREIAINTMLELDQKNATLSTTGSKSEETLYFEEINTPFFSHKEDAFNDFDYESLLYKKHSQEGPAIAVADIDNDGNDDIFIGGAYGQAGKLYLQKDDGKFIKTSFETEIIFEDTAAVFTDIDGDKDLDLVVGSGGNFSGARTGVRYYKNEGNGNFVRGKIIKPTNSNISVIAPQDIDGDGDMDLFIGSQNIIGAYGITPESYLLVNQGNGTFSDQTDKIAPELKSIGMVTDAIWTDIFGSGQRSLVVVGDWMAPRIFQAQNGKLALKKELFDQYSGWYQSVNASDLNQDGKTDLIFGNRGQNSIYKADLKNPMKLFVADFDKNGKSEQIMTRTVNNKDMPIVLKKELTAQINSLKKQNTSFSEYATKSIQQLFPSKVLEQSTIRTATNFSSFIAYNSGNGNFKVEELPTEAQLSNIAAIVTKDINQDGKMDIIVAGNEFEYKPQFSRLDASKGLVLIQTEDSKFKPLKKSGLAIKDEVKELNWISNNSGTFYLFAGINDQKPKLYRMLSKE